jgi:translation initiation factor 2 subunit 1
MRLIDQVAAALKIEPAATHTLFASALIERYGSLYAAFEVASADPKLFQKENEKAPWAAAFLKVARDNIVPPHVEISGTLEVRDLSADGVDHVKAALMLAEEVDPQSIRIQYVGAPRYRIRVSAGQYKQAEETMKRATEAAIASIRKAGGEGSFTRA